MNMFDSVRKTRVPHQLPIHSSDELSQRTSSGDREPTTADSSGDPTAPTTGGGGQGGQSSGGDSSADADDETPASEPADLPLDQVFEILKNSRRRQTLHYLYDNGGDATLSDLAEHIAALENDTTVDAISSSQRKRVYVGLYQCHLPKMDDMNIVDFDKNRGTIGLAENAGQIAPYLEDEERPTWYRLYAAVTAVGSGLFAVSVLASAPFGLTPAAVLAALLGVMALCAGGHAYVERGQTDTEDDPVAS